MKNKLKTAADNKKDLRRKAKARFKKLKNEKPLPKTKADLIKLVKELHIHQIELEIINEELKRTKSETEDLIKSQITERKQKEDGLIDSEKRFLRLSENAQDMIYRMSLPDGKYEYVSPAANEIFGYSPEEFYNAPKLIQQAIHPDWNIYFEEQWTNLIKGIIPPTYEYQIIHKSGKIHWLNQRNILVKNDIGKPIAIEGIVTDITERKKAEEKIKLSEYNLAEAERIGNTGSWTYDVVTDTASWSENMFRIFDVDPEMPTELVFKHFVENLVIENDRPNVLSIFLDALAGIRPYDLEYRVIKNDGSIRNIHAQAETVRNEEGKAIRMIGKVEDFTERKQAEEALRESEKHSREIFNYSSVPIWEEDFSKVKQSLDSIKKSGISDFKKYFDINPDEVKRLATEVEIIDVNETSLEFYGVRNKEELVTTLPNWFIDESWDTFKEELISLAEGKTKFEGQIPVVTPKGEIKYLILKLTVPPGFEDTLKRVLVSFFDISENKKAEERVKENEIKFRNVFENSVDAIGVSKQGIHLFVNPAYLTLFGYNHSDELTGKLIIDLIAPSERRKILDFVRLRSKGEFVPATYETRGLRKDGSEFDMDVHVSYYEAGKEIHTLVILRDITERKQAEAVLLYHQELLQAMGTAAKIGGWEFDTASGKGTWTEEVARIHDLDPNDETNVQLGLSFYRDESRSKIENAIKEAIEFAKPYSLVLEMTTAKGNNKWVQTIGHPIIENEKVIKLRGSFQDITERMQVEESLRQSDAFNRTIVASIPMNLFLKDRDCSYLSVNKRFAESLGHSESDFVGRSDYDFFPHKMAEDFQTVDRYVMESRKIKDLEERYMAGDQNRWAHTIKAPILDDSGNVIAMLGLFEDITERKRVEEELQASKENLSLVFNNTYDIQILFEVEQDKKLRMLTVNQNYIEALVLLGLPRYPADYFTEKYRDELLLQFGFLKEDIEAEEQYFLRAIESGSLVQYEQIIPAPTKKMTIEVMILPVVNKEGAYKHLLYTSRDITERKQAEQEIIDSQKKLRALTARLERVKEEERINLSRELHDHLGQNLTGLKMDIASLAKKIGKMSSLESEELLVKTSGMIVLIDELINSVRKISAELRPNVLDYLGLIPAIEWQMEECQKRTDIDCKFKTNVSKVDLGAQINSSVFRIVQEAFTNIIRHSKASKVVVSIDEKPDSIKLVIIDNGIGIKDEAISNIRSLGIIGMKERTLQFNGTLHLENAPNGGTLFTLIIPKRSEK